MNGNKAPVDFSDPTAVGEAVTAYAKKAARYKGITEWLRMQEQYFTQWQHLIRHGVQPTKSALIKPMPKLATGSLLLRRMRERQALINDMEHLHNGLIKFGMGFSPPWGEWQGDGHCEGVPGVPPSAYNELAAVIGIWDPNESDEEKD